MSVRKRVSRIFGRHPAWMLSIVLGLALAAFAVTAPSMAHGLNLASAPAGTAFTYQGRLDKSGSPVTDVCSFQFGLYDAASGGAQVGSTLTKNSINVNNGLFTVDLDFGGSAFDGNARYLQIAVKCSGESAYTTLSGRVALNPAPYASYALQAPWGGLSGVPAGFSDGTDNDTLGGLSCANGQIAKWNGSAWACSNDATGSGGSYWSLSGNAGTNPATDFLGTTDNVTLTLRANNIPLFRVGPNNAIAGGSGSAVSPAAHGVFIGGGENNTVADNFVVIGGGSGNHISATWATVGGGSQNIAGWYADHSFIGGGFNNSTVFTGTVVGGGEYNMVQGRYGFIGGGTWNFVDIDGLFSVIGGGTHNGITDTYGTIGGGERNTIKQFSPWGVIGGGYANSINGGAYSTIGGGYLNYAAAMTATIAGGEHISVTGQASTVGGGIYNVVTDDYAFVGGGVYNANKGYTAVIGGGRNNTVNTNGAYAVIGGGVGNGAAGEFPTVGGGSYNYAVLTGTVVGGGNFNYANGAYGTIAGGDNNTITAQDSSIGGGSGSTVTGTYGTIGGGLSNAVYADYGTVGGGSGSTITGTYGTIGGGSNNQALGPYGVIGGGQINQVSGDASTVAGGAHNQATGYNAAVGGGLRNTASGNRATIPGGMDNEAAGGGSFAAGQDAHALHDGAFVWDGYWLGSLSSSGTGQFLARAQGGFWFGDTTGNITPTIGFGKFISTSTGAYLSTGGTWTNASDVNLKTNFTPVDSQAVLDLVAQLPISTWNYKAQSADIRHMGPMAQDFYAAFGLGEDDRHISTVDAAGVSLAAIQGLYAQNQALQAENAALQAQVDALDARLSALEAAATPAKHGQVPGWWLIVGAVLAVGAGLERRKS